MNIPGEDVLSTSWHRVRDAGTAIGGLAGATLSNNALARSFPKVKDFMATGAGLAIARRGAKVALSTVRRNPVLAIAGAVALAGAGALYMAAQKRKAEAEANGGADGNGRASQRLSAGSRRTNANGSSAKPRGRATGARKTRSSTTAE